MLNCGFIVIKGGIMKNYRIIKPYDDDPNYIRIINDDDIKIIHEINCKVYNRIKTGVGDLLRMVSIDLNETSDIKKRFRAVPDAGFQMMGNESLVNQKDMKNIIEFFKIIQQIDPIPPKAFKEIKELIDFDLTIFFKHDLIQQMVKEGRHQEALKLALEEDQKGDDEALTMLANCYQENKDERNYLNVLAHYPKGHKLYRKANKLLHSHLQTLPIPENEDKHFSLLENKFRFALNGRLKLETTQYFNELCGNTNLSPEVQDIKGDPDTLIKIACVQRKMKKELIKLSTGSEKSENLNNNNNNNNKFFESKGYLLQDFSPQSFEKAMCQAAKEGNISDLNFLIKQEGININAQHKKKTTALHCAVKNGHANCVEVLLKTNNADKKILDSRNKTPLDYAKESNNPEIKKLFGLEHTKQNDCTETIVLN